MKRCSVSSVISKNKLNKMWFQTLWNGTLKRLTLSSVDKDLGQSNLSYIPCRNEKGSSHFWNQHGSLNMHLLWNLAVIFLDIYLQNMKTYVHTCTCTWIFIAALFIVVKTERNPSNHQWMDNEIVLQSQWNITQQ